MTTLDKLQMVVPRYKNSPVDVITQSWKHYGRKIDKDRVFVIKIAILHIEYSKYYKHEKSCLGLVAH